MCIGSQFRILKTLSRSFNMQRLKVYLVKIASFDLEQVNVIISLIIYSYMLTSFEPLRRRIRPACVTWTLLPFSFIMVPQLQCVLNQQQT